MDFTDIEYEKVGCAVTIHLNRPETLNAFTYDTLREIREAVDRAVADEEVVGIIFTGKGRGFSSGLDASVLAAVTSGDSMSAMKAPSSGQVADEQLPGIFSYLLEVPKPVIAAVNGVAAGGGLILALMSDIRIASEAAAFTTVFLKRGLVAEHGSSWILPRLMGTGRALDLLWMSDKIDAARALQLGLVDQVVSADTLLASARDYIERLAVTSSPAAIAETKRLVYRHLGSNYTDALIEANDSQNKFVSGEDAKEGAMALIEKRAPQFKRLGANS
ncbi:MAG: enoyl-CoA hydratase/carnithine racemase [Limisphaerales bacterium]|jgi:enoyl-CoA hydratase/carnithine racemase